MQATPYIILGIVLAIEACFIIGSCIDEKNGYPVLLVIPSFLSLISQFGADSFSDGLTEESCFTVDSWNFFFGFGVLSALALPIFLWHVKTIGELSLGLMLGGAVLQVIGYYIYTDVLKKQEQDINGF